MEFPYNEKNRRQKNLIQVENLEVSFGIGDKMLKAVRGVEFVLHEGEMLAIVGESGSGKSVTAMSLLRLNGQNAFCKGRVHINGKNIDFLNEKEIREMRKSEFGVIFQEPSTSFDPIYDIGRTFFETFRIKEPKIKRKESDLRAIALLEEVHIDDSKERLKNYPHQFSGGMLQRVMIALALANNPRILIADEPTTALDVTIQGEIMALIMEQKRKRNLSIVFITHDLALVSSVADKVLVMYGGMLMEEASPSTLFHQPKSPYTTALLKSMPKRGAHYTEGLLDAIPGNVVNPFEESVGCLFAPRCYKAKSDCFKSLPALIDGVRCLYPNMEGGR